MGKASFVDQAAGADEPVGGRPTMTPHMPPRGATLTTCFCDTRPRTDTPYLVEATVLSDDQPPRRQERQGIASARSQTEFGNASAGNSVSRPGTTGGAPSGARNGVSRSAFTNG